MQNDEAREHKSIDAKDQSVVEKFFEGTLWRSRFLVLMAVFFGMIGAVVLFVVASVDIFHVVGFTITGLFGHEHPADFHAQIVGEIIGAVDLYLIAIVMFIFSFGLYELFISEVDEANTGSSRILEIHTLDELKDKIAKVIVMVLIVSFFQRVLHMDYQGGLEMLYFALSILALSLGLYFMHKGGKH